MLLDEIDTDLVPVLLRTNAICPINFAIIEVSHQQFVRCSVKSYLNHKSDELSGPGVLLVATIVTYVF